VLTVRPLAFPGEVVVSAVACRPQPYPGVQSVLEPGFDHHFFAQHIPKVCRVPFEHLTSFCPPESQVRGSYVGHQGDASGRLVLAHDGPLDLVG
jgi:hypothetical protein